MTDELTGYSAVQLARLMREKKVSPVEVLEAHLVAIDKLNPVLNAFCTVAADEAREAARIAEAALLDGTASGQLTGVPIGIKDLTPTAGIRTTWGSTGV